MLACLLSLSIATMFFFGVCEGVAQSGGGQPAAGAPGTPSPALGGIRRSIISWRDLRRTDPTIHRTLWKSKTPLGNAELYIVLALLIGLVTVVVGCWLSDNCWSPEPDLGPPLA